VIRKKYSVHKDYHFSHNTGGKRCFKLPVLINGSILMCNNDMILQSHRNDIVRKKSTRSINSTGIVQHNVLILGDSHLRGSAVKLRSKLSAKFKVFGVVRPGAGAEKNCELLC
jgi:hypothetical protein